MKCPKCHYLSFDPEPRCRNCGYTLSLDDPEMDIPLARDEPDAPLADFAFRDPDPEPAPDMRIDSTARATHLPPAPPIAPAAELSRRTRTTPGPFDTRNDIDFGDESPATRAIADIAAPSNDEIDDEPQDDHLPVVPPAPPPAAVRRTITPAPRQAAPATAELPLFVKGIPAESPSPADDVVPSSTFPAPGTAAQYTPRARNAGAGVPVTPASGVAPSPIAPSEPRPPLAVRRPTPDVPVRSRNASSSLEFEPADGDLLGHLRDDDTFEAGEETVQTREVRAADSAGPLPRLGAAAVDAGILAALGAAVVWTTLRWCDLVWEQAAQLPAAPMGAFVGLVALGYLFMFTAAGGQTPGKMAVGIRVVDAGADEVGDDPISTWQALYRESVTIPSVLLLGAGFLPALFGRERAMHDRLARTRVVRA